MVVVEPRNKAGELIPPSGDLNVSLLDPAAGSEVEARVGRWNFSTDETSRLYRRTTLGDGIQLNLLWQDQPPAHEKLELFVRLTTPDGRKLLTRRPITVTLAPAPVTPAEPTPSEEPRKLEPEPVVADVPPAEPKPAQPKAVAAAPTPAQPKQVPSPVATPTVSAVAPKPIAAEPMAVTPTPIAAAPTPIARPHTPVASPVPTARVASVRQLWPATAQKDPFEIIPIVTPKPIAAPQPMPPQPVVTPQPMTLPQPVVTPQPIAPQPVVAPDARPSTTWRVLTADASRSGLQTRVAVRPPAEEQVAIPQEGTEARDASSQQTGATATAKPQWAPFRR
jgi:hypothetical protein